MDKDTTCIWLSILKNLETYKINLIPREQLILGEKLGSGGFASVYKATLMHSIQSSQIARTVAVKRSFISYKNFFNQITELQFLMKVKEHCPGVITIIGFCIERNDEKHGVDCDIAMELMRYSLRDYISNWPKEKTVKERIQILCRIASAIESLHYHEIVHRDIKPENILMDDKLNVFIADLGISRFMKKEDDLNETQNFVGSFSYMSPECFDNKYSFKSDVYSFGLIAYEIFSNLSAEIQAEAIMKKVSPIELIQDWKSNFPKELPQLTKIIEGSLQYDAHKRLDSSEVKKQLTFLMFNVK